MARRFFETFTTVFVAELPPDDISLGGNSAKKTVVKIYITLQSCANVSPTLAVNSDTVSVILKSLDPNSSRRDDGVHPRFL